MLPDWRLHFSELSSFLEDQESWANYTDTVLAFPLVPIQRIFLLLPGHLRSVWVDDCGWVDGRRLIRQRPILYQTIRLASQD